MDVSHESSSQRSALAHVPSSDAAPAILRHEHLVRINDPANARGAFLTRDQVWTGLWRTVVAPFAFDPTVDACRVESVTMDRVVRRITRGGATTVDEVDSSPPDALTIRLDPRGVHAGSSLRIEIEEPAPAMLFVRFTYELAGRAELPAEQATAIRAAYEASDVDRIRQVRAYALRAGGGER